MYDLLSNSNALVNTAKLSKHVVHASYCSKHCPFIISDPHDNTTRWCISIISILQMRKRRHRGLRNIPTVTQANPDAYAFPYFPFSKA